MYVQGEKMNPANKKLYRSRTNRMIFGVCAGIAEFFAIDPTIVRLVFVAGALLGFGSFILIYLVMFFVVPEEPLG
jgi:phage shock protein C